MKPEPLLPVPAKVEAKRLAVAETIVPDASVAALLAPLAVQVEARARRVLGSLATPLDKAERDQPESTLGNWASDALRTQMSESIGRKIDVCFTNNGGLRRSLPAGDVTEGMLVELMPFDNAVVVLDLDAERARKLLQKVATRGDPASGLTYVRHDGKPSALLVGGAPLTEDKRYLVCTNDYLFEGGGGYGMEDIKGVTYTGVLMRDAFIAAFEAEHAAGRAVKSVLDGRALDVQDGHAPDGHAPDGHAPDGHAPDGHAPDGHAQDDEETKNDSATPDDEKAAKR